MHTAYVSIGSNQDRVRNVDAAIAQLEAAFGALRLSTVYETVAVGFEGPPFLNLCASFQTPLEPPAVVSLLREIENRCGRDRSQPRFASRTLDVDLLLLGELKGSFDGIELPRGENAEVAFVLVPLAELAPAVIDPLSGRSYRDLAAEIDLSAAGLRAVPWPSPELN